MPIFGADDDGGGGAVARKRKWGETAGADVAGAGGAGSGAGAGFGPGAAARKPESTLDALMREEEARKAQAAAQAAAHEAKAAAEAEAEAKAEQERAPKSATRSRRDYWLHEGIIVKVLHKKLAEGKYYKTKASVLRVVDRYGAEVEAHEDGAKLRLDQDDLETVIPSKGGRLLLVNGPHVGEEGRLLSIDVDKYTVTLELTTGANKGTVLEGVEYEDVCKIDRELR